MSLKDYCFTEAVSYFFTKETLNTQQDNRGSEIPSRSLWLKITMLFVSLERIDPIVQLQCATETNGSFSGATRKLQRNTSGWQSEHFWEYTRCVQFLLRMSPPWHLVDTTGLEIEGGLAEY